MKKTAQNETQGGYAGAIVEIQNQCFVPLLFVEGQSRADVKHTKELKG